MSPSAGTTWAMPGLFRHEHPERRALRLEVRLLHVSEVLAIHLERHRPVCADDELVRVVHVEDVRRALLALPGQSPRSDLGETPRFELSRRDEVEPELELRLRRDAQRDPADVAVRVAVCHKRERDAAEAHHLHGRREARTALGEDPRERAGERKIVRSLAARSAERVDTAYDLRVDPEAAAEREASAVDATQRYAPLGSRGRKRTSRGDRVPGQAESARENTRRA